MQNKLYSLTTFAIKIMSIKLLGIYKIQYTPLMTASTV